MTHGAFDPAREARAFRPARWLPGPHLQTLWSRFLRRGPRVGFRRETWETPDADLLELDWVNPGMKDAFDVKRYDGNPIEVGPFTVSTAKMKHPIRAYGFRIEAEPRAAREQAVVRIALRKRRRYR